MNNASLELGGDNWAAKDTKLLAATVSDDSGRFYPQEFTFSRGSNLSATRVNADGNIEKGYENLLLQSNSFITTWTQVSISPPTSGQAGYDGSTDAWYFEKTGAFGRLQQSISTSGVQTLSVYLKAKDSSWVNIEAGGTNTSRQYFNLTAPIETAKGSSSNIISSSIEDAGNGWRKCSITYEGTKTFAFIFIAEGNGQINGTSGSLYIQDAMLNQGLAALPYIESGSSAVKAGILENEPRIDYSSGTPSLLLEPQRTNLAINSEYFQGYNKTRQTLVNNSTASPEGLINATELNDTAVSGTHFIQIRNGVVDGGVLSFFAKQNTHRYVQAGPSSSISKRVFFDLQDGVMATIGNDAESYYGIEDYGNGWYRCYIAFGNLESPSIFNAVGDGSNFAHNNYTGDGSGVYIYGAQVEQDVSYHTSYIPTYGTSVTRGADAQSELTIPNGNVSEGTIFYEFDKAQAPTSFDITPFKIGNNRMLRISQYNPNMRFAINENAINYNETNSYNAHIKVAVSYSSSSVKLFINGNLRATHNTYSGSGNVIVPASGLQSTQIGCSIESKQLLYFPEALSDTECIKLTTI